MKVPISQAMEYFPELLIRRFTPTKGPFPSFVGTLWKTTDAYTQKDIAVILFDPKETFGAQADREKKHFFEEISILRCVDHPNIAKYFSHGVIPNPPLAYWTREWVEGRTLEEVFSDSETTPNFSFTYWVTVQLLEGLNALNRQGIVHRWVHPRNIILEESGTLKVVECGSWYHPPLKDYQELDERFDYISPEHLKPEQFDIRSDLFSVGWVLRQLLTRELPPIARKNLEQIEVMLIAGHLELNDFQHYSHLKGHEEPLQNLSNTFLSLEQRKRFPNPRLAGIHVQQTFRSILERDVLTYVRNPLLEEQKARSTVLAEVPVGQEPVRSGTNRPLKEASETLAKPAKNSHKEVDFVYFAAAEGTVGRPWGEKNACPQKKVVVSPFYISKYPIRVGQFLDFFLEAEPSLSTVGTGTYFFVKRVGEENFAVPEDCLDYPITGVSHAGAEAYCSWLSKKLNKKVLLPTEVQWEGAASWDLKKRVKTTYPWGMMPDRQRANLSRKWHSPAETLLPVTALPESASPAGCVQMLGNVWEWCRDAYVPDAYDRYLGRDPWISEKVGKTDLRSVRGGDFSMSFQQLTNSTRCFLSGGVRMKSVGFRVVIETN